MKVLNLLSRCYVRLIGLVFLPLSFSCMGAADLPYDSGSTGADGPLTFRSFFSPGRWQHAAVFDEARGEIVIYGGRGSRGTLGDTWVWNGEAWRLIVPAQSPPPSFSHAMAYDAARRQVVLFGGMGLGGKPLADTWLWNGTNWLQASPAQSPPALSDHALAYDAKRQQIVLFGGNSSSRSYLSETWIWDGTNWTQGTPATIPQGRSGHAMTYDSKNERVVMFAGLGTSDSRKETWTWDGLNWTVHSSEVFPRVSQGYAMGYDAGRQQVLLFGGTSSAFGDSISSNSWAWDGLAWQQLTTGPGPSARVQHAMAYDTTRKRMVLTGGDRNSAETWLYNGSEWTFWSGDVATFDMAAKPDGVWNFTTIEVQAGLTVFFKGNAGNTPVRWLASSNVVISGTLNLDGQNGSRDPIPGNEARGGPGGYAGGLGAIRFDQSGTYVGAPGQGPGGGAPGVGPNSPNIIGKMGTYSGTYGNAYLQPLIGGSGGGGGGSYDVADGGNGGGGGGAILIASSRDITIDGGISAEGGRAPFGGGSGSGGAIRLVADRISGAGSLRATSGGRIRIEAFYRSLAGNSNPSSSISAPVATKSFNDLGTLVVASVAGQNVAQPTRGDSLNPDVLFTSSGPVVVTVKAQRVPDNTPVTLRVTTSSGVITKPGQGEPAVVLVGGEASFNVTVPAGLGTVQAYAQFTQP